ncbi:hypothetical protein CBF90_09795 [Microbacterium sp. AISO3]|uniref:hyaluronate lyase N-terminal domain-containing protein n=1 Tax=Microbacterium sp. AISO3 TaxID=2002831 RepID=UPI000B4D2463|nr:hypothetical protein [Microbacterium sp. AISO3]OWP21963.1 hypothetical protein CBF90_09795 [Microbacterium sp. AISO3]
MALAQFRFRQGTTAQWAESSAILAAGEPGFDTTVNRMKIGDGRNQWSLLKWQDVDPGTLARIEKAAAAVDGATGANDAVMATVAADPASAFAAQIGAHYLSVNGTQVVAGQKSFREFPRVQSSLGSKITAKPLGDGSAGLVDAVHDDSFGYLYHLQAGPNTTGSTAMIGVGLDKGNGHGYLISSKAGGRGLEAVNNPSSTGDLARLRNWSHDAAALDVVLNVGAQPARLRQSTGEGFGDGVAVAGSTAFTSATANFQASDVGRSISQLTSRGEGFVFAANTAIASVVDATTVTLDKAAVRTGSGVNFQIVGRAAVNSQQILEVLDSAGNERVGITPARLKASSGTVIQVENAASNGRLTTVENARVGLYAANGTNFRRHELYGQNYFWGSLRAYPAAATIGAESGPVDAFKFSTSGVGFNGTDPLAKPTITGSRNGNMALESLLSALAGMGLITNATTP